MVFEYDHLFVRIPRALRTISLQSFTGQIKIRKSKKAFVEGFFNKIKEEQAINPFGGVRTAEEENLGEFFMTSNACYDVARFQQSNDLSI